jgi:hypothetical protein
VPGKRLITPDDVRDGARSLHDAVRRRGWPTLSAARGRIYVLFDVRPAVSDVYRKNHPSLAGRAMFGWYSENQPESTIQIVQDPLIDGEKIKDCVKEGVIVRTRTDANTAGARLRDYRKAQAAMVSGAQAVSTDYYPGAPDPLHTSFTVRLPDGPWRAAARSVCRKAVLCVHERRQSARIRAQWHSLIPPPRVTFAPAAAKHCHMVGPAVASALL